MLALHQANRVPDHAERNKIIPAQELGDNAQDAPAVLVKSLDRRHRLAALHGLRLAKNALIPGLVDIEPENASAKLALHNDTSRTNVGLRRLRGFENQRARSEREEDKAG